MWVETSVYSLFYFYFTIYYLPYPANIRFLRIILQIYFIEEIFFLFILLGYNCGFFLNNISYYKMLLNYVKLFYNTFYNLVFYAVY